MQPVQPNTNLPGLTQSEAVVLSEKLHHIGHDGFFFCARQCITHYGEDSIPYHPGEKSCLNRCVSKVREGLFMAVEIKKEFEAKLRTNELPYQWMRDVESGKLSQ